MVAAVTVPSKEQLMVPTLQALRTLGGSGSIGEIADQVVQDLPLSEEQQVLSHLDGPQTELEYRLAWSRTYLKTMGLVTNSSRGVWALTDNGVATTADPGVEDVVARWTLEYERSRKPTKSTTTVEPATVERLADEQAWQDLLLENLLDMSPDGFERLAMRLLREADFDSVKVTGGTNDKGIDGIGVYRLGLISFHVFFQCKRYRGSVSSNAVRDFRGAMAGRGDKGLLITTGSFTAEAKKEASREGATPIDLIDGTRLCALLKQYALGVSTVLVEDVAVDPTFFKDI